MGVIFFIYNAIFSLVLLIIVLIASVVAVCAKNPDTRYQPMRDDRGSFIKSQSQLTTELDALGATARGDSKHGWNKTGARIEDDDDSLSGGSSSDPSRLQSQQTAYQGGQYPSMDAGSGRHMPPSYQTRERAVSPYEPSQTTSMMNHSQDFRQQSSGGSPSPWQRGAGYD